MASRIAKECQTIERGSGDKIGQCLLAFSGLTFGFGFAFMWGWELSLIMLVGLPLLGIGGGAMFMVVKQGYGARMKCYAQSAGYAD